MSASGIPEQERGRVFRRFYRLEGSRCLPGNGLGLSLVAAVAKLHDSELHIEDNDPGLWISMAFFKTLITKVTKEKLDGFPLEKVGDSSTQDE